MEDNHVLDAHRRSLALLENIYPDTLKIAGVLSEVARITRISPQESFIDLSYQAQEIRRIVSKYIQLTQEKIEQIESLQYAALTPKLRTLAVCPFCKGAKQTATRDSASVVTFHGCDVCSARGYIILEES